MSAPRPAAVERQPKYVVRSVVHAVSVLAAFRRHDERLALRDVQARTGLSSTVVFRHLQTLRYWGVVRKIAKNRYMCFTLLNGAALGGTESPASGARVAGLGGLSLTLRTARRRRVDPPPRSGAPSGDERP